MVKLEGFFLHSIFFNISWTVYEIGKKWEIKKYVSQTKDFKFYDNSTLVNCFALVNDGRNQYDPGACKFGRLGQLCFTSCSVCVPVFFLTDISVFSEKILVKIQLILLMSLEIFGKYLISLNWKKEKTPLILLSNVSHKVCRCNFGYLLFFDFNNIWWKTFCPTSIFTSLFKVACSINQILLPLLEGFMDKSGFKSHRLPYRQQWFKTYSKYIFKFTWGIIIQSCGINWRKQQTHNQLHSSRQTRENNIRFSKHLQTPFYMGHNHPKLWD